MNNFPSYLGDGSIINSVSRPLMKYKHEVDAKLSSFGQNVWIGAKCVVARNVKLHDNVILSDGTFVEEDVVVGEGTLLTYRCLVCAGVIIGKNCVIGGFIGESTIIGDNCRIFGDVVHGHLDPTKDWDAPTSMEPGANIQSNVFIGFGAKITKPITISNNVYILPNSIVSINVPSFHIVKGINEIIHYQSWKGALAKSAFFDKQLAS
jgi:UDP-3-O-[3-hydroxymyristoyl] glucosamine N-acyltransferase